jgi:hypothetical protein
MNAVLDNENLAGDLSQRKSLLIIQAQFQQALGQHAEAARLFLEAAVLEEKMADNFRQAGNADDAAISLFSAASCYRKRGTSRQSRQAGGRSSGFGQFRSFRRRDSAIS